MSEYKRYFEKILHEYDIPDMKRNPDDVQFDDETDVDAFNVDPLDANVGFKNNNMQRDRENLDKIISDVDSIIERLPKMSEQLAALERSFSGIGSASKTVAAVNQKLNDMKGELQGYIISLPAQKDEKEAEMQPERG